MRLKRVSILLAWAIMGPAFGGEWAEGVPYCTNWEYAIRMSQETGKPLFIYTGWKQAGRCHVSDAVRRAIRTLSAGKQKSSAKYRALLRENFVLLSDFLQSAQDEGRTHGPEGEAYQPFRIEISYTPVLTFKDSEGRTLLTRVGLSLKPEEALEELRRMIDRALQQNGPIRIPGATRALVRALHSARKSEEAGRMAPAISGYLKVVALGGDARKFPERPPALAMEARKALGRLERQAIQELDGIRKLASADPAAARRRYQRLSRQYGELEAVQARIREALERL